MMLPPKLDTQRLPSLSNASELGGRSPVTAPPVVDLIARLGASDDEAARRDASKRTTLPRSESAIQRFFDLSNARPCGDWRPPRITSAVASPDAARALAF